MRFEKMAPEFAADGVSGGAVLLLLADLLDLLAWAFDDGELRCRYGVVPDADRFELDKVEGDVTRCVFIEPIDGAAMFFSRLWRNPNGPVGVKVGEVGQDLAEVVVVGLFELVLDDHLAPHPIVAVEVETERAYALLRSSMVTSKSRTSLR